MEIVIYDLEILDSSTFSRFATWPLEPRKGHLCRKIAFAAVDASSFGTESNFALGIENHEREFVKVQYFEMEF